MLLDISDAQLIQKNDRTSAMRRHMKIVDFTRRYVSVYLWNRHATHAGKTIYDRFQEQHAESIIVTLKYVIVTKYGEISVQTINKSRIYMDPPIQETPEMKIWYAIHSFIMTLEKCFILTYSNK